METHDAYTRLLGLALRGGNLVIGSDAVQSAAFAGTVRLLMLSADASPHICRDAQTWAERGNCMLIALPCDKSELGGALGRGSVAVAALTDTGLAAAVGERLARLDPARYADTAERLKRKVDRAGERRAAHARARPGKGVHAAREAVKCGPVTADAVKRKPGTARNATGQKPVAACDSAKQKAVAARSTAGRKSGARQEPGAAHHTAGYKSGTVRNPAGQKPVAHDTTGQKPAAARDSVKRKSGAVGKAGTRNPVRRKSGAAAHTPSTRRKNTDT